MNLKALLAKKPIHSILGTYELPHRFLAYFAAQCARSAIKYNSVPVCLDAIVFAERFGNGEELSKNLLVDAAKIATTYAASFAVASLMAPAAYAADAAAYAAETAARTPSNAVGAAAQAAYAAIYSRHSENHEQTLKDLLIDLIEKRLTTVEKLLIFG